MTNQGVLERPKTRAKVLAWLSEGKGPSEIATLVSTKKQPVSRQAVLAFKKRHEAELAPIVAEVERQITDFAIAKVVNRVADAQLRRDMLAAVREARAAGGDGMETGIVARQYKMIGAGKSAQLVEEFKVDTAFLAEWRANDDYVGQLLGQMPKTPAIELNDNRTYVLQVVKSDNAIPLG